MRLRSSGKRVAIIGAGGAGSCAALELASRGHEVELFESRGEAVSEASFVNEGKIHLGFLYAKDAGMRTAASMIEGALEFEEGLRRWIPFDAREVVSTPFYYCVHRGSLMDPEALSSHYARCAAIYRDRAAATGRDYLGLGTGVHSERLDEKEAARIVDPRYFSAVFRTTERAVDPRLVARKLRRALAAEPRIQLRPRHRVVGVSEDRRERYRLRIEHEGDVFEETFRDVVNTSWYRRLPIDRPMGLVPPRDWSHRYKFGNRVRGAVDTDAVPSCTMVQGPYGDIVNFGPHGLFLSWYPIGRIGMSTAETPPDWHGAYSPEERYDVFSRSLDELRRRCARLADLKIEREQVSPDGGVIYALGTTDVHESESELHERVEIGIQSRGRYHTVDTGKYTLVPYWGRRIADRVEGLGS